MATDSPITTISSWHRHHLRHRKRSATAEEAFASAVYYSECSLGGISPRGAATAEENVRRNHSRWWLRGDDPNHPTLQSVDANKIKSSSSDLKSSGKDQAMQSDAAAGNNSNAEGTLEEAGNNDVRDAINHDVDVLRQDNSNSPIFVHDNDYGLSFGTLGNFSSERILQTATSRSSTPPTSVVGETQHELSQATSESVAYGSFTSSSSCNSNASISRSSRPTMKRQRTDDPPPFDQTVIDAKIIAAKTELLSSLEQEGISPAFKVALASLERYSNHNVLSKQRELSSVSTPATTTTTNQDGADSTNIDGTWRMISPPEYPSSLGKNSNGEGLFTLGRMSFDMYQPSDLICSIQKQYNTIQSVEPDEVPLYVPRSLIREVAEGRNAKCRGGLKTYNIIVLFTIEQAPTSTEGDTTTTKDQPKEPLRGILTNYGYALPDPTHPNRKSIWFTGGTIESAQDHSLDEWKRIFGATTASKDKSNEIAEDQADGASSSASNRSCKQTSFAEAEKARMLASKIMLGAVHEPMDSRGVVGFHLKRPIGGHGSAYCDVIYMDEDVRIMRGHSGSIYVFKKE